jgi:dipeptidyl aminopeptidase/acylaminoacyl peptidase
MNRNAFFALLVAIGVAIVVTAGLLPTGSSSVERATASAGDLIGQGKCAFAPAPPAAQAAALPDVRFGRRRDVPWIGPPARIAEWVSPTSALLLVLSGPQAGREAMALLQPETGEMRTLGERTTAMSLPRWSVEAQAVVERADARFSALATPREAAEGDAAYVNAEVQSVADPTGARVAAWSSHRAQLLDVASGDECDLAINRVEEGADRPIIDAAWSSDGRYLAVLMLADAERLGPTVLRVLDLQAGVYRDAAVDALVVSAMNWIPGRSELLATAVDLGAPDAADAMYVVDARTGQGARVADAPALFAPAYWGLRFSPDGSSLAAACVQPDADGVVRRGAICTWEVDVR